jgi:transcriptional regulator with XRE-family HTH domain
VKSDKPFPETLQGLMEERDLSIRRLAKQLREETGWGSISTVHWLVRGDLRPTYEAMERVAKVLRIDPDTFAEFRLSAARRALDPEQVGLKRALRNLDHR